jgi:2-methylisocitrate lyase-like PEP mutase family enzyme
VSSQAEKGQRFRDLHAGEPFVMPNPWDVGSARVLESLGFPALATTSSGFAFTLGRVDGTVALDEMGAHVDALASATSVPLSVDLENGYGPEPRDAARAIERVIESGAVGGSIEDYDRDDRRLYELGHAAERVAAAAEVAHAAAFPFMVTARAENHIRDNPDLDDTIARLTAYADAGADVLFAPGLRVIGDVRKVCDAVSKPVNVLAWPATTLAGIFEAGAQRVSVGGRLTWVAVAAMTDAAARLADGDLSGLEADAAPREWLGPPAART